MNMATLSGCAMSVTQMWPLEKYARFVPEESGQVLPQKDVANKGGTWKHYQSTRDIHIQMTLLESNHLMVSGGTQVYESFSMWNSQKWIKGVTKGDSILFIYRLNDQNRRFRIKFAQTTSHSSSEACKSCITCLAPLITIREMEASSVNSVAESQLPSGCEDSQTLSQQTIATQQAIQDLQPELAIASQRPQSLCTSSDQGSTISEQLAMNEGSNPSLSNFGDSQVTSKQSDQFITVSSSAKSLSEGKLLGLAYASTNFPTEQLGAFIRLCLTDSNFPGFVEAVEKELNNIK